MQNSWKILQIYLDGHSVFCYIESVPDGAICFHILYVEGIWCSLVASLVEWVTKRPKLRSTGVVVIPELGDTHL